MGVILEYLFFRYTAVYGCISSSILEKTNQESGFCLYPIPLFSADSLRFWGVAVSLSVMVWHGVLYVENRILYKNCNGNRIVGVRRSFDSSNHFLQTYHHRSVLKNKQTFLLNPFFSSYTCNADFKLTPSMLTAFPLRFAASTRCSYHEYRHPNMVIKQRK